MKLRFILFSMVVLGLLVACSANQQDASIPESAIYESRVVLPNRSDTVIAPEPVATKGTQVVYSSSTNKAKTVFQLLRGKWQSTGDEKSVIKLKGHRYSDYYDGLPLDTAEFILAKSGSAEVGA